MNSLEIARAALPSWNVSPPQSAAFVSGGLTHQLLRVETASETYALKLWAPRATADAKGRARLERGETLASLALENGIPALAALANADENLLEYFGNRWVSLYPWVEGETLPPTPAMSQRCAQMGAHLGALHALKVRFPDQSAPVPEAFERGHFTEIAHDAHAIDAPFDARLWDVLDDLEAANDLAMRAQLELRDGWVTGHLDFDQKNVLWRGDSPTILDWENAKPIHPALEAMGAALSWAGQSAGAPDEASFAAFFGGYRQKSVLDVAGVGRAVDGVLGKWIIWLEFNLQRLLDPQIADTPEYQIALDAGMHALGATLQLRADGEMYRDWIGRI